METRRPDIYINADVDVLEFVKRLEVVASVEMGLEVKPNYEIREDKDYYDLYIWPEQSLPHKLLMGRLMGYPNGKAQAHISMFARDWVPTLTNDIYIEAALRLFDPIIRCYNQAYRSRRRIIVRHYEPKLPPRTKRLFDRFIGQSNKIGLHPSDWELFYEFVNACHDYRVKLDETDLTYFLVNEGFPEDYAYRITHVYYHIREFLKGQKRRNYKRYWFRPDEGRTDMR